jgi:sulfate transport system ATP-binding protein
VANRVVLLNQGRIEQIGTPEDVYHHPANAFVCEFLGSVNLFHSRVEEGKVYLASCPLTCRRKAPPTQSRL